MGDPRGSGGSRGTTSRGTTSRPGGQPPRPKPTVDAPRAAAYDVMKAVRVDGAYTNLVLPQVLATYALTGRDAAFTTELVSGTIRRQGTYDVIIDACLDRPKLEGKVRDALRLGVHQLLAMRVPTHAAISTTVDLVRAKIGQGPAGFTNAVLRKVAAHDLDIWVRQVAPTDAVGFATVAHSHPRWVVEALREAVGAEDLPALLAADNAPPRVTLVARPGLVSPDELPGTASTQSPYAVELGSGDPGAIPAVAEGRAGVQDEGSQLVALAMVGATVEGRDERWLDLCAGPGGKSALLATLAAGRGALVLANERLEHRASLVARSTRAARAGLLGVVAGDGNVPAWAPDAFDRVLVDAPCSGLGALRRRPEARWRRSLKDLDELVPLQRALLDSALDSVRPGGVVLYATCSPALAETAGVVSSVLAGRDDAELDDTWAALAAVDGVRLDRDGCRGPLDPTVQLWPHRHGTDAMFLALLRRS